MRILVVDSNIVLAKKVKEFLLKHVRDVYVDLASNLPVMRRRIETSHYDYIIADVLATIDSEAMFKELRESGIPIVIWTVIHDGGNIFETQTNFRNCITRKPSSEDNFLEALSPVLTAAALRPESVIS